MPFQMLILGEVFGFDQVDIFWEWLTKHAFCVYVRPLLEFCTQIWSRHYKYLIDKVESVQRYFTKRLSGLSQLSYRDRLLVKLDLQ